MDELVSQFIEITKISNPEIAKYYLEVSDGDLQVAIGMMYEDGGGAVCEDDCKETTQESSGDMTVLEWNIQGLLPDCIRERTLAVSNIIKEIKPSVVMLQEVVVPSYSYLKSALKNEYNCHSSVELRLGECPQYFTAIFVSKTSFRACDAKVSVFFGSSQGRDLLSVSGQCNGHDVCMMTSHLESTKQGESERKRQLAEVYERMLHAPLKQTVVFGADTNLRDHEFDSLERNGKFDRSKVNDIWNMLGSPAETRFSWDLQKNDNQVKDGKARLRFERLYSRLVDRDDKSHYKPTGMRFVGTERLPCGMFPSDHWGVLVTFRA